MTTQKVYTPRKGSYGDQIIKMLTTNELTLDQIAGRISNTKSNKNWTSGVHAIWNQVKILMEKGVVKREERLNESTKRIANFYSLV